MAHHPRHPHPAGTARRNAGFSLIELMVGLVIGMIAVFVMMQVFQSAEGFKRTTTGGNDAQTSGAIALDNLQREIQQSGYGLNNSLLLGCPVALPNGSVLTNLSPVTINHPSVPAGDANTDTLVIVSGANSILPAGDWVNGHTGAAFTTSTPNVFAVGDLVVFAEQLRGTGEVRPKGACNLGNLLVQAVTAQAGTSVTVGTAVAGGGEGALINLGPAANAKVLAFAVRNGALTMCDFLQDDCTANGSRNDTTVWVPIENGVVSLRAQYGRDTTATMDAIVDFYDQTTPATACDWLRMAAVRVALVVRGGQYEKTDTVTGNNVTTAVPTWMGSTATANSVATPIVLSGDADWQHYRYRTIQSTIPLRNNAWAGIEASNVTDGECR